MTTINISTTFPRSDHELVFADGGMDVVGVIKAVDLAWVFVADPTGMAELDVDAKQVVSNAVAIDLLVSRLMKT
jgi:hypothetical protein